MKTQLKKLTDQIANADASKAEHQRHCDLLTAAELKRDRLIASDAVNDPKTRQAIVDVDIDCRMLPHRVAAFEAQAEALEKSLAPLGAELEGAVADECIRLEALLESAGLKKFIAALKPLAVLKDEDLESAAAYALARTGWGGQIATIRTNTRSIPPRSLPGNAEPLFKLATIIEKFCA